MKNRILIISLSVLSFIIVGSLFVYAENYSSSEISYTKNDGTTINVKESVDELYSHLGDCPEGMNCLTNDEKTNLQNTYLNSCPNGNFCVPNQYRALAISSTYLNGDGDVCNSKDVGCVCYHMKNYGSEKFNYGNHTGCTFVSKTCFYMGNAWAGEIGHLFDCESLSWTGYGWNCGNGYCGTCSGVITCET